MTFDVDDAAFRGLGAFLLSVPFLPLRRLFGPLEGAEALVPPGEWALGLAIFGTGSWLVAMAAGERAPSLRRITEGWAGRAGRPVTVGAALLLAGLLLAASWEAFERSPHLVDSVVQLFQAKIFAAGRLVAPPPPGDGFFTTLHMIEDAGGWYSQYPPGHAALLAAGVAAGAPWSVPLVLSLGSTALLFGAVRRMYGRTCARLTVLLLVLCPFFWFMGASFMNHVSALFFVCLFLYLFVRWEEGGRAGWSLAAGAALGAAALIRPLTAVIVAVTFAAFALGSRRRGHVLLAGAGFAATASLYLVFNAQVTGDPLLPGYLELWGESHGLGFHETPWGGRHTPAAGLRNELLDLSLLNLYLFEWPVPALLPVAGGFALGWTAERWDRRLLLAFLAIPAGYLFYWHRDAFLGPRFLYSGLAFLIPLTARALLEAGRRLEGRRLQLGDLFRPVDAGTWAAVFVLSAVGYGVLYGGPQRFRVYATGMPSMKTDIRAEAQDAGIDRGLVFVKVSWGNRILSRLRGLGVSADLATKAYRNVGHCELHGMIERVYRGEWARGRLKTALPDAVARDDSLVRTDRLNDDRTLRVRAGRPLTRECRQEIRYDQSGYTNFTPHLVANAPDLSGRFVVARDLTPRNGPLRSEFPGRGAYLFDGDRFRSLSDGRRSSASGGRGRSSEAPGRRSSTARPFLRPGHSR